MDNSTQVWWAAFVRSIVVAVATGIAAGTSALASGGDERTAVIAGVGAFAAAVIVRFGAEGGYDANRARTGNVQPGDVGAGRQTMKQPPAPDPPEDDPTTL